MSAPALIKKDDLKRIFCAAKEANYPVSVTISVASGEIVIRPAASDDAPAANPWDEGDDEEQMAA